jgi:hypothetical protein
MDCEGLVFSGENPLPPIHSQKKSQKPFWQSLSKLLLKSKQRIYMEAIHLRQNLIESITALPDDMLEEMSKFLNFLKYKKHSNNENLDKDTLLDSFRDSIKDIKKLKDGDSSVLYDGSLDDMIRELR